MFLQIPDVLNQVQLHHITTALDAAAWTDGKFSEWTVSEDVRGILSTIETTPKFISAAMPTNVLPPHFYRDAPGEPSLLEVNKTIRTTPGGTNRVRNDLTATVFLTDPAAYEGGDLVIKNGHNEQCIKLPAGYMVLYSSGSRQEVRPVTKGISFRCSLWIQSMIRDDGQRKILFDMDTALQALSEKMPNDPSIIKLTGVYHNLLRYWARL